MSFYNNIIDGLIRFYYSYIGKDREVEMSSNEIGQVNFRMAFFTGEGLGEEIEARAPCAIRVNHQGQRYNVKFNKNPVRGVDCTGIEKVLYT